MPNVRVVPALLTSDPAALRKMVELAGTFAEYVQVDIMDGRFVPSQSITSRDLAAVRIGFAWEAHLMVRAPETYMAAFQQAGARKVIFHYEAAASPEDCISQARRLGIQVGMALNPETPVAAAMPLMRLLDSVLFLTVNPGFYGSKFIPEVLDKVVELRRLYPESSIGVDGGISQKNIADAVRAGANDICVGSGIFLQPDPAASYRHLQKLVEQAASHHIR